ncbi:MAG: hypothetical protein ATN35_10535 [Epulopiscium sp. Nele67-Bin004]|nr:MAG: hypothetical protein ATN35_10535 [Epulopiscium sp. Nele67-Bin004]
MKKLFLIGAVASVALVGCSSGESTPDEVAITMTAEEVYNATVDGVGMTPMVMDADDSLVVDLYGVDLSLVTDYKVIMPAMTGQITEIAVFRVEDMEDVNTVAQNLTSRVQDLQNGGAFYPSHIEIVNEAQVVVHQNYVLMAVDEEVAQLVANFNSIFE